VAKVEDEMDRLGRALRDREAELKAARSRAADLEQKASRLEVARELLRQDAEVQQADAAVAQASLKAEIERLRRQPPPPPVTNLIESARSKAEVARIAEERDRLGRTVGDREAELAKARERAAELESRASRAEAGQKLAQQAVASQQANATSAQAALKAEIERLRRQPPPPPVTNLIESARSKAEVAKIAEERDRLGRTVGDREAELAKARERAAELESRASRAEAEQKLAQQAVASQQANATSAQAALKAEIERLRRQPPPPPVTNLIESARSKAEVAKIAEERDRLGRTVGDREAELAKARERAAELESRASRAEAEQKLAQ